jgi:thymidylate synthase (FAD)
MVNATFEITCSRDISRQLLRHRSFHFQEFSQRYAEAKSAPFREARLQDTKNRQNSLQTDDEALHLWWEQAQQEALNTSFCKYWQALEKGIAKEQARALLPEGLTETRLYMNGTLRSWIHFCQLRCGPETQKEARDIANAVSNHMWRLFPDSWEAVFGSEGQG